MSAAVVSGAAALLLDARPALTPAQVKAALQLTASRVRGGWSDRGGSGELERGGGGGSWWTRQGTWTLPSHIVESQ